MSQVKGGLERVRNVWRVHPLGGCLSDHLCPVLPVGTWCVWRIRCRCGRRGWRRLLNYGVTEEGVNTNVYDGGAFGGYTRWAVVFLIIFVLFILLVPFASKQVCTTVPVN